MAKNNGYSLNLPSLDDLFTTEAEREDAKLEKVVLLYAGRNQRLSQPSLPGAHGRRHEGDGAKCPGEWGAGARPGAS